MNPNIQSSEESSDDESWTYESGKILGLKKPPLLNLDMLENKTTETFETYEKELDHEFDDARKWFGLIMTIDDFKKFIWSSKEDLSDNSILFAEKYASQASRGEIPR